MDSQFLPDTILLDQNDYCVIVRNVNIIYVTWKYSVRWNKKHLVTQSITNNVYSEKDICR